VENHIRKVNSVFGIYLMGECDLIEILMTILVRMLTIFMLNENI